MIRGFGLAAWLLVAVATPAAAEQTRIDNLSAVDLFALADRARAAGETDVAVTCYDALARDPDAQVRAEARFRKGMMFADAGRWREAATAFRALLDEQPKAPRVRLELARALAAMGDEGGARRQVRQAQAAGLPAEVAQSVGRFDRALRSRKRWGGTFELALAPDSNINRATQARVLDTIIAPLTLSDDARARSGTGAHLAGQAFARIGLGGDLALVPRLAGQANVYRDHAFDDLSGSALVGLEWLHGRERLSASAGRTRRWYGGRVYADTDTVTIDWLHGLGRTSQLVVTASASDARYARNDLQDGRLFDLGLSYERALSARGGFSAALSATRQTARDPGYATAAGGLTLTGWREAGHTTLFASAGIRRTEADAALFLFGARRQEWLTSARIGGTFRGLAVHGFAPYARLVVERNASTVKLYDYRRVATEFGITRAF
ncbi:tetratricopeptide repeat protein [Novosphingobium sp.]|uniref:surface lipoprotein assembly modifier n=1 Tax=Novosphingobium sp. TaxID=1874826 RepID=UPI0038BAA4E6